MCPEGEEKPVFEGLKIGKAEVFPFGPVYRPMSLFGREFYSGELLTKRIEELKQRLKMLEDLFDLKVEVIHTNCQYHAFRDEVCNNCGQFVSEDIVMQVIKYHLKNERSDERSKS
jgi:hypothetical protein